MGSSDCARSKDEKSKGQLGHLDWTVVDVQQRASMQKVEDRQTLVNSKSEKMNVEIFVTLP